MRKKNVSLFLSLLIVFGFITLIGTKSDAAPGPLPSGVHSVVDFPNVRLVDPTSKVADNNYEISEEYATLIRPSSKLTFTSKGARKDVTNVKLGSGATIQFYGSDISKTPNSPHYVQLNKAGIYQGDYMDVRIHFKGIESPGNETGRRIDFSTSNNKTGNHGGFLQMDYQGSPNNAQAYIVVEFLRSGTDIPLNYKGTWNYKRLNDYKSVSVNTNEEKLHDLFAYKYPRSNVYPGKLKERLKSSDHYMFYEPRDQFAGDKLTKWPIPNYLIEGGNDFLQFYGRAYNSDDLRENFSVSFDAKDGKYPFVFSIINDRGTGWLKYESEPITKMQLPTPQIVGLESEKGIYRFEASQDMPMQISENFYPFDYKMEIEFDTEIEMIPGSSYEITDVDGENVADRYFTKPSVSPDGRKIVFGLKDAANTLKSKNFVDNSYTIAMDVKMKGDKDIYGKSYKEYFEKYNFVDPDTGQSQVKNYYRLPMRVQYETMEFTGKRKSIQSEAKSKMIAKPTVSAGKTVQVEEGSSTADWKTRFKPEDLFEGIDPVLPNEKMVISFVEDKKFTKKETTQVKVILKGEDSGVEHEDATQMVTVNVVAARKANIHHVDTNGKELAPTSTKNGFENQDYDFSNEKKEIDNHTFEKIDEVKGDKAIGKYPTDDRDINIYYVYKMNNQKVTVNYVDDNGNSIAAPESKDYEPNTDHVIDSKVINGYEVASAKVDGESKPLANGKVTASVKDKAVTVTFAYKSTHYSMNLASDIAKVSPRGTINYTLDVTSGMNYPEGSDVADYKDVEITVPVDEKITDVSDIKVLNSKDEVIGQGQYSDGKITATLTEVVKDTENIKLTYKATVSNEAKAGQVIKAKATMTATYSVNNEERTASHNSNNVDVTVQESANKTIKIHYQDDKGKDIIKAVEETGKELQDYDFKNKQIDIPGYKFIRVDKKGLPIEGVLPAGGKAEDIYLIYELAEFGLTVNYVDESGAKISKETSKKIISGNSYTIDSEVVPGYKVKEVKVDDVKGDLTNDGKVEIVAKDKAVSVKFVYESVHFSMSLKADPKTVSPKGTIDYILDVTSGMEYPAGTDTENYKDLEIKIPIDEKIDNVKDIKVIDSKGNIIGAGKFTKNPNQISITLTKNVKNTENIRVTYSSVVSNDVSENDIVKTKASMKASFNVNGVDKEINRESNSADVKIKASDTKSVYIHYVDESGKEISAITEKEGAELQDYDFRGEIKTIGGYKYLKIDEKIGAPITGTYSLGPGDVNIYVVYELAEMPVSVNYVDEAGNKISGTSTYELLSGNKHAVNSAVVPGYKVKSVEVDGKAGDLTADDKVEVDVKDQPISVTFIYKSVHYSMKLTANPMDVSPKGIVKYALNVTSGMMYPEGTASDNYKDVLITIPVTNQITDVKNIKVLNSKDEVIGDGEYVKDNQIKVTFTKNVKNTENFKVTYDAIISNTVVENDLIKTVATMKANYNVNGVTQEIARESNEAVVKVKSSDKKAVTIHYLDETGKEISDSVSKLGAELQDYNYSGEIKEIAGYKFKKVDTADGGLPIKGTFKAGSDAENIYVVYEHDELKVTVNFEDEAGKKISKENITKYLSGKEYTIESVKIPGYKIKSVKVDGKDKTMSSLGKVVISVIDKPVSVVFVYESVHYSLDLSVDKQAISQGEKLTYALDVKSGMVYAEDQTSKDYKNVEITIPIDNRLTDVKDIEVLNAKKESIGTGKYNEATQSVMVSLKGSVKDTENIKVTYSAKVKDDAKTNDVIEAKASMKASYEVNDSDVEIKGDSNVVKTKITGGLKLASAPSIIDFGDVKYLAKKQRVENPTLNGKLEVVDTRETKKNWDLQVSIEQPLKDGDRLLPSKLRYKTDDDDLILNSDAQSVYKNTDQTDRVVISDDWGTTSGSKGIKLEFDSVDKLKVGDYTGKIRWTVVDSK